MDMGKAEFELSDHVSCVPRNAGKPNYDDYRTNTVISLPSFMGKARILTEQFLG